MAKMDTTDGRCMRTDSPRQCCTVPALLLPKQNSAVASENTVLTPSRPVTPIITHQHIQQRSLVELFGCSHGLHLQQQPVAAVSCGGAAPVCAASRTHICLRDREQLQKHGPGLPAPNSWLGSSSSQYSEPEYWQDNGIGKHLSRRPSTVHPPNSTAQTQILGVGCHIHRVYCLAST
ncbi:hypothetical protein BC831DRAFT_527679 [Entophlyctis helioformis]|nr:hypothetical protein BC831DRAFT_527679 [Entophlyctis helioformis]